MTAPTQPSQSTIDELERQDAIESMAAIVKRCGSPLAAAVDFFGNGRRWHELWMCSDDPALEWSRAREAASAAATKLEGEAAQRMREVADAYSALIALLGAFVDGYDWGAPTDELMELAQAGMNARQPVADSF